MVDALLDRIPKTETHDIENPSQPVVSPEIPTTSDPDKEPVDFEAWYKNRAEQAQIKLVKKAISPWKSIEQKTQELPPKNKSGDIETVKTHTIADSIRRQKLSLEARFKGVKDIKKFNAVTNYLENNLKSWETKNVNYPKGLSQEKKDKIHEKWESKGYHISKFYDWFVEDDKKAVLKLQYYAPFKATSEHIPMLKALVETHHDSTQILESLKNLGFNPRTEDLMGTQYGNHVDQVVSLANSSHPFEAIKIAANIESWDNSWITYSGEKGQIALLTEWAQSENISQVVDPEKMRKIDLVSKVLDVQVSANNFDKLKAFVEDEETTRFIACLVDTQERKHDRNFLQCVTNARELGLTSKVLELDEAGLAVKDVMDILSSKAPAEEIRSRVDNYLDNQDIKDVLSDDAKKEFCATIANITGFKIPPDRILPILSSSASYEETAYLYGLLYEGQRLPFYYNDEVLHTIYQIQNQTALKDAYTSVGFQKFLADFTKTYGFKPQERDFFQASTNYSRQKTDLYNVYVDSELREGLLDLKTVRLIKEIGEWINLSEAETYIKLSQTQGIIEGLELLRSFGIKHESGRTNPHLHSAEVIGKILNNNPDALEKFTSQEMKDFVEKIKNEFGWELELYNFGDILYFYQNSELINKLFEPENSRFIKQISGRWLNSDEIQTLLKLDTNTRNLISQLNEHFAYRPSLIGGWFAEEKVLKEASENPDLLNKVLTPEKILLIKSLQEQLRYQFAVQDLKVFADAPDNLMNFINDIKDRYKYYFRKEDLKNIVGMSHVEDKGTLFNIVGLLESKLKLQFKPNRFLIYKNLYSVSDLDKKLDEAISTDFIKQLSDESQIEDFLKLGADFELYKKLVQYWPAELTKSLADTLNAQENARGLVNLYEEKEKDRDKISGVIKFLQKNGSQVEGREVSVTLVSSYLNAFGEYAPEDILDSVNRYANEGTVNIFSSDSIKQLGEFISEFGPLHTPNLLKAYTTIKNDGEISTELSSLGITQNGREGIRQLKSIYKEVSANVVESGTISRDIENPVVQDILSLATRFRTSQWARNGEIATIINKFNSDIASGEVLPAPSEYAPQSIHIRELDSDRKFEFSQPAIDKFKTLRQELQEAASWSQEDEEALRQRVSRQVIEFVASQQVSLDRQLSQLDESLDAKGINDPKRRDAAKRGITIQQEKLTGFLSKVGSGESLEDLIKESSEFGAQSNSKDVEGVLASTLRKLLFVKAIKINPEYATDPLDIPTSLVNQGNLPVESVLRMMEVVQNGVKYEAMPTLQLSKDAQKFIDKSVIGMNAFQEEIKRSQQILDGVSREFRLIPGRNILTEFSGYYSDACWTRESDITRKNPNMISVPFIRDTKDGPQIDGGTLLIETKLSNGESAVVIRGINPRENVIRRLHAGDFFEGVVSAVEVWAKARGIKNIVAPVGSSGALSNRPTINSYVSNTYHNLAHLGETVNFNSYDITDKCLYIKAVK